MSQAFIDELKQLSSKALIKSTVKAASDKNVLAGYTAFNKIVGEHKQHIGDHEYFRRTYQEQQNAISSLIELTKEVKRRKLIPKIITKITTKTTDQGTVTTKTRTVI